MLWCLNISATVKYIHYHGYVYASLSLLNVSNNTFTSETTVFVILVLREKRYFDIYRPDQLKLRLTNNKATTV